MTFRRNGANTGITKRIKKYNNKSIIIAHARNIAIEKRLEKNFLYFGFFSK